VVTRRRRSASRSARSPTLALEPLVRALGQPARGPLSPARPPDVPPSCSLGQLLLALALGGLGARVGLLRARYRLACLASRSAKSPALALDPSVRVLGKLARGQLLARARARRARRPHSACCSRSAGSAPALGLLRSASSRAARYRPRAPFGLLVYACPPGMVLLGLPVCSAGAAMACRPGRGWAVLVVTNLFAVSF
jgi:hypothetical protein